MGTSPLVKTKGVNAGQINVITAGSGTGKSVFNSSLFNSVVSGNGVQTVWIDEYDHASAQPYPRGEVLKFKGDPLALALAWRFHGWENWKIAEELMKSTSWDIFAHKDSVAEAEKIKRYYRNRFMLKAIKTSEQGMSRFRQDLYNYVESNDPYTVYKNDIPMIVKLPEFYKEDTMMDDMSKQYNMTEQFYKNTQSETRTLYALDKHHRKTKRSDQVYYWFRDDNNCVYRLSLDPKNLLLHLFEREFEKDSLNISGTFYFTKTRGQDYVFYSMNNWKIL